jgi:RNA polymerase sigma-70 factor (ECF subfamily)
MGTATISAVVGGRSSMWTGRADRSSEKQRAQTVAVQRDSRSTVGPVPVKAGETSSPHPVGFEPPSRDGERAALTPERAAVIAEQKAMAALAARCVAGDGAAWEELARTQHRRIYGICYRFMGSASEAEDLTQDVFIKVFRNIDSFDPAKGGFNTWLTTLTRNMLVDNYRRARMDRVTDSLDETVSGEEDGATKLDRLADTGRNQEQLVSGMELRAQIQEALKQVSPELREAVILRDLEDMDYKDIAEVLGVPQGTVKSRISRGRSELAKLLKRIEGQVM